MDNRPIGVFDSGLGGLTAVKELNAIMPKESIVYFGDTGRIPYGTKSPKTVTKYAEQAVAFLKTYNVKAILAACGTVSSVADSAGVNSGLPYVNVLHATASAAVEKSKNGKIGVIATPATILSGAYKRELLMQNSELEVFEHATPLLVPLVESGHVSPDDELLRMVVRKSLEALTKQGIDTLILGCTHYPIIAKAISDFMGESVSLINSGKEAATELSQILTAIDSLSNVRNQDFFYVSDLTKNFSTVAESFLGHKITGKQVDILKIAVPRSERSCNYSKRRNPNLSSKRRATQNKNKNIDER